MSKLDIIRAWKDAAYRMSLSEAERAQLPEHPAGLVDIDTDAVNGGIAAVVACKTAGCCNLSKGLLVGVSSPYQLQTDLRLIKSF